MFTTYSLRHSCIRVHAPRRAMRVSVRRMCLERRVAIGSQGSASFQHRPFSYCRAAPLLWLRSPKCCSRVRLRLPPVSLTQQRRLERCRLRWRTHSVVGTRRSRFVAPPFRFRSHRLSSSHKRSCKGRRPTAGGADRPEATCHNPPPWRPAAHQHVGRHDHDQSDFRHLPSTLLGCFTGAGTNCSMPGALHHQSR